MTANFFKRVLLEIHIKIVTDKMSCFGCGSKIQEGKVDETDLVMSW